MKTFHVANLATALLAGHAYAYFAHHISWDNVDHHATSTGSLGRRDLLEEGVNGWGFFDQLLDHSNPELGTFKQRFWYGTEFWKGPGSPIILFNAGEDNAAGANESYTTNSTLSGRYAQENGGAVIILEHRVSCF